MVLGCGNDRLACWGRAAALIMPGESTRRWIRGYPGNGRRLLRHLDIAFVSVIVLVGASQLASHFRSNALSNRLGNITQQLHRLERLAAPSSESTPSSPRDTQSEELAERLGDLSQRIVALERTVLDLSEYGSVTSEVAPGLSAAQEHEGKHEGDAQDTIADNVEELRLNHEEGAPDEARTAQIQLALYDKLATQVRLGTIEIGVIDCRSTGCRLAWRYPADLSYEEGFSLENDVMAALAEAGLQSGTRVSDGMGTTETYFAP